MQDKSLKKEDERKRLIEWETHELTPQAIFNLPPVDMQSLKTEQRPRSIHYTESDIKTAYKKLSLQFHPDKNPDVASAAAFNVITNAKDYLLYTIARNDTDINDNPFYQYYHRRKYHQPKTSPQLILERLIKKGYQSKNDGSLLNIAKQIQQHMEQHPDLLNYECDYSNILNFTTGGKSALYAAAQWNEPTLFQWLLKKDADPLTKTVFGVNPFEIALNSGHKKIIEALLIDKGQEWVKNQFDHLLHHNENALSPDFIRIYSQLFPEAFNLEEMIKQYPLYIPIFARLGHISADRETSLLKQYIIGCPKLYSQMKKEHQLDTFMIVATLAQDKSVSMLNRISYYKKELNPVFIAALCNIWPEIAPNFCRYSVLFDGPAPRKPAEFNEFMAGLIYMIAGITLALLAYHFWPIIVLWEPQHIVFTLFIVGFTNITGLLLLPKIAYEYTSRVFETRKINKILIENNFFKSSESIPPIQSQTSEEQVNDLSAMSPV